MTGSQRRSKGADLISGLYAASAVSSFASLGVLFLVAMVFVSHWRSREAMRSATGFVGSAHARTDRVFVYCCFTGVLIVTVTFAVFLVEVLQLLFPSFMSDASTARASAARTMFALILPMFGPAMIFNVFSAQARDDREAVATPTLEPTTP